MEVLLEWRCSAREMNRYTNKEGSGGLVREDKGKSLVNAPVDRKKLR